MLLGKFYQLFQNFIMQVLKNNFQFYLLFASITTNILKVYL